MNKFKKFIAIIILLMTLSSCLVVGGIFAFADTDAGATVINLFPNGDCEKTSTEASMGGTLVLADSSEDKHGGNNAYLMTSGESKQIFYSINSDLSQAVINGINEGKFFEYSYWLKGATENAIATSKLSFKSHNATDQGWTNILLGDKLADNSYSAEIKLTNEWQQYSNTIAMVMGNDGYIDYFQNDSYISYTGVNNLQRIMQVELYLGVKAGSNAIVDDIVFKSTTVSKDVTVTLTSDGEVLTGKTLTIKNGEGEIVNPTVTEDNGIYAISGLQFSSLKEMFTFTVSGEENFVGAINFEDENITRSVDGDVLVTVVDEKGNEISDANVLIENISATNNNDGTYCFTDIYENKEVVVSKEGYLTAYANINVFYPEITIILKQPIPAAQLEGNLIDNGNFESDDIFWSSGDTFKAEITDKYQKDGNKSLKIDFTGSVLQVVNNTRAINLGDLSTGVTFVIKSNILTITNSIITFSPMFTLTKTNGSGAWIMGEVGSGSKEVRYSNDWQSIETKIYVKFNSAESTFEYKIDDGEMITVSEVKNVTAYNLRFYSRTPGEFAVDNVAMFKYYNAEIEVADCQNTAIEGATIKVNSQEVNTTYADGKYTLTDLYSANNITVEKDGIVIGTGAITPDSTTLKIKKAHVLGDLIQAVDPTDDAHGTMAHYECSVCGKYFSDAEGNTEIENINTYSVKFFNEDGTTQNGATQIVNHGMSAAVPTAPEITGYTFSHWATSGGVKVSDFTNITSNLSVKAVYNANTYTITYELDGGTNGENPTEYTYGTEVTLSDATKTGYTFNGWYTNATFEGEAVTSITATDLGNKTLYAKFTANKYTITYVLDNGTNASTNPSEYTYGTVVTLADATKEGYTFGGWYTEESFTNQVTEISATQEGNVTLYAKFTKNPVNYTVTINHSEDGMSATVVIAPEGTTIDTNLVAEGYKLEGIYTDPNYTTKFDANTKITADTTLYAKWEVLSTEPDTDTDAETEKSGCGSSVTAVSTIATVVCVGIAVAFVVSKKKEIE